MAVGGGGQRWVVVGGGEGGVYPAVPTFTQVCETPCFKPAHTQTRCDFGLKSTYPVYRGNLDNFILAPDSKNFYF